MHSIRRALPVIDVQNAYFDGQLPIGFPDRRRSLANIIAAMDAAHDHVVPVVVAQDITRAAGGKAA